MARRKKPDVSIVVPTYNQSDKLRRLFESLEAMEGAPPFEVVIVNDCSPDDTERVVRDWTRQERVFPTEYLRLERNSGPATARNAGTEKARGSIVVYTDSDCRAERSWLRKLVRKLDPESGVVGVGGAVWPLNPEGFFARYNTVNRILEPMDSLVYLITANCCFIRDRVLEVDGFDEDVRRPGGEDVGISIKMYQKGWRFAFDPEAVVLHDYREGLRDFYRTWKNYAHGCGYVIGKHFGDVDDVDMDPVWNRHTIRPAWIGPRMTREVLRIQHEKSRKTGVPWPQDLAFMVLRLFQLHIHFWHFRQGERVFRRD